MCATKTRTRTAKASLTIPAPTRFKFLNRKRDDPSLLSKVDPMSPSPSSSTNTVNYLQSKAAEWKMKLTGGSTGFPPFFGSNGVTNSCAAQLKAELTKDDEWEEVEEVDSDVIEEDFDDKEDGPVCSAVFKLPECSGKFGKTGRPLSNQQNGAFLNESNTAGSEGHHRSLLDDYERVCTIGTGTFGRVILVRDRELGKYFALKVMSISDVIHMKQVEHVHSEKKVLEKLNHTFIINLYAAQHDNRCLYMLFDYAPGGELFSYLRSSGSFPNSTCRFYTAEIVCALDYLHKKNIVYRDLKPENLLLDKYGHLKLTDFGFAKELFDRTWTLCGTPEYLAPEVIEGKGHNKAVDWWALGILIYEMQAGYPPFFGDNALKIYEKILEARVKFPKKFDLVAKDLVKKLLVPDRIHRLGSLKNGADDLKNHKWFKHINWEEVVERKLHPPITPKLYAEGDTGNFDEYDEESIDDIPIADQSDLDLFKGW